ncbi:MAG: GAF domain-containing protein [Thermodesulfobacteriota bacterium]
MTRSVKINIEVFKSVTKAISQSEQLDVMTNHLAQLLVASMEIKACAIYVLEPETRELERIASFGLSMGYVGKGPIIAEKSIAECMTGTPVIISDTSASERIQYPDEVRKEGIAAIVSIPITFSGTVLGTLRLYHGKVWEPAEEDLNSLVLLAEFVGLAMNYTCLMDAICEINDVISRRIPPRILPDRCG